MFSGQKVVKSMFFIFVSGASFRTGPRNQTSKINHRFWFLGPVLKLAQTGFGFLGQFQKRGKKNMSFPEMGLETASFVERGLGKSSVDQCSCSSVGSRLLCGFMSSAIRT